MFKTLSLLTWDKAVIGALVGLDLEQISPLFFAAIYFTLHVCNQEKLLFHMFWDMTSICKILHFGPSFQQTSDSTHTQIDGVDIASLLKHKNPQEIFF